MWRHISGIISIFVNYSHYWHKDQIWNVWVSFLKWIISKFRYNNDRCAIIIYIFLHSIEIFIVYCIELKIPWYLYIYATTMISAKKQNTKNKNISELNRQILFKPAGYQYQVLIQLNKQKKSKSYISMKKYFHVKYCGWLSSNSNGYWIGKIFRYAITAENHHFLFFYCISCVSCWYWWSYGAIINCKWMNTYTLHKQNSRNRICIATNRYTNSEIHSITIRIWWYSTTILYMKIFFHWTVEFWFFLFH